MGEAFAADIPRILVAGDSMDSVKQSAALCLLRLYKASPDLVPMGEWTARVVHLLNDQHMIVSSASTDLQDYTYYFVPAPWLSVKLLRLLQCYPPPGTAEPTGAGGWGPPTPWLGRGSGCWGEPNLLVRACNQLGQFLQHRETNLRYLALESMCTLASSEFSHEAVKTHIDTVINALKTERDVSVRQRAADLLYAMCDRSNAKQIVSEMLRYLETADYAIREEIVLKVAILAEKYAVDYSWYVDTILNLIRIAGDYVSEEVWYRVLQIVTNRDDVQGYAAKTVFEFHLCSVATRALLLSTYIKFINLFPETKATIQGVLRAGSQLRNADVELQQRAVEYLTLSSVASTDVLATVLEEMPPFPERESSILAKLKRKKGPGAGSALDDGRREPSSHDINGGVEPTPSTVSTPSPSADLLGLRAAPPPAAPPAPSGAGNLLVDVFSDGPAAQPSLGPTPEEAFLSPGPEDIGPPIPEADELLNKFVCRNNGVLFENQLLQIGVKSEFRQNLGRMYLFYGNKTSVQFQNFSPTVLAVQTKRVASQVDGGAQVQQVLNIECLRDFLTPPLLSVRFRYGGAPQSLTLKLPLLGFGSALLDNVDPNPENFVGAGIIQTKALQVGCLLRLEPNAQAQMYRLTLRTSKEPVSRHLCELLAQQF
eukprot:bmy_06365T0